MISRNFFTDIYPIKFLGEVVEFLDSKRRPVTESDRRAGNYPYYGANGKQGTIDDYIFDEPLVLLAEDGGHFGNPERGIAYQISGKTWVNNHAHVLRPKENIDLAFLCRVLENYDVTPFVTGTTRGKLTQAGAAGIPIPIPPLAEQKRIAEILDRTQSLISKRKEALTKLDILTHSIFLEMFGDPVTNPKNWDEEKTLGEVADIVSGITKGRKLNGRNVREVPYLAVVNVQDQKLDLSVIKTIEAKEDEIERYRLQVNDLVLTEGGDPDKLGRGTIWHGELPECIHQNHIFRVRIKLNTLHPRFLMWLIGSKRGKSYFLKSAKQTTGIASINMTQLKGFPVLIPPLQLQKEFAQRVEAVEKLKATHRGSLSELKALFASLQHRAFRGEL